MDSTIPLDRIPLFERLSGSRSVLVAGAGGGFDVLAGLPIALRLMARGHTVHFANLTFSYLGGADGRWVAPHVMAVHADTPSRERYFPERTLAQWLRGRGLDMPVHAIEKLGVSPLREAYRSLVTRLAIDALVLVDGGTDLLMRGDEAGLGTPEEDMASLAAVHGLEVPVKVAVCIGFGVDAYHGVCHAHFLENAAALQKDGGGLGIFALTAGSPEGRAYLDAVGFANAQTPQRPSIVNGCIAAAVEGKFGNVQFTDRTRNTELFVNPLMALYFAFDLDAVARRSLYLDRLEDTETVFEVSARIEAFRETVEPRPRRSIPH